MATYKVGLTAPSDHDESATSISFHDNPDTGMCADITWSTDNDGTCIVESWNDDIGLTTFWHADTFADAADLARLITGTVEA